MNEKLIDARIALNKTISHLEQLLAGARTLFGTVESVRVHLPTLSADSAKTRFGDVQRQAAALGKLAGDVEISTDIRDVVADLQAAE